MPAILLKVALLHGCFSRFLNCTNVNQIAQNIEILSIRFSALE